MKKPKPAPVPLQNWNDLREVALSCFHDAVECLAAIEIVERGNRPAVVQELARQGALEAAIHMGDAALFRLHVVVCRAFAPVNHCDDRHMRTAIDFLRSRSSEERDATLQAHLLNAVQLFEAIENDTRLAKLRKMRNKLLAHITRPKPTIEIATYRDLFDVTKSTVEIWVELARGAKQATLPLDFFLEDYRKSLEAFWLRWA
ncbi:hypothetical protein SAMN05216304_102739 [Bosea sp. OK403]|uniref:AbiU2 domain-containing protein n=1 Tax=Bosea sp. OK403 TaxID=1855286 RepID=UPI0008EC35EF|nr:hypothetical protein [Bosea sp. OK403]SFI43518.1 hypothetical protein SAMN05216304_102739 [Bosea sp. OK403]